MVVDKGMIGGDGDMGNIDSNEMMLVDKGSGDGGGDIGNTGNNNDESDGKIG